MESAFGVEHGDEFAKFEMPKIPGAGGILKPLGASIGRGTSDLGRSIGGGFGAKQLKAGNNIRAGLAGSTGNALRSAGKGMMARPALTGAGAVTAGGAGIGGVSFGLGRRNRNQ